MRETVIKANRYRIFFVFFVLFIVFTTGFSQAESYQKTDSGIKTVINGIGIEIQFYSSYTVRILKWPNGKDFIKKSLSVVKTPEKVDYIATQDDSELLLESQGLLVSLNLEDGQLSFRTPEDKLLLSEKVSGTKFIDFNDAGNQTYSISQSYVLAKDEPIYGLGILQKGKMSLRDISVHMVQGNTEDFVPFFQSVKGYGLFWDNYSPTDFVDNQDNTSFSSEVGDCIDYYVMFGKNSDGVIACMRDLTGQVPMFPLWTYGYWQSKERYKSQDETVDVVRKYRDLGVPLDGIIQDWQYWGGNYLWNAMEFLNTEFPDPQKMIDQIHGMNAHIIVSIWSSFGPMTKQFREMEPKGMLLDMGTWPQSGLTSWPPNREYPSGVKPYDPYNPEARNIYWKYLNQGLFSLGIDGWWMDSTEPDHLDFRPKDFDNQTYLGSFRKVRNAYPLMTVGGVYNHQREKTSDKRVFILTRSAFAGQQRYGANTWSGDVTASWSSLRNQISAGLNFSMTGIPHWNSDIGGFFLSRFRRKLNDPDYRELYTRWIQFGAFCPMMRSHGADAPREIYQFGQKGDEIYDSIEKYINLRYMLLPYIYSTSWDVTVNQSSMMRALVMDFASDKQALDINDQYMFGKSFLVCPVTEGMYSSIGQADSNTTKSRQVYLPAGTDWVDFWTGETLKGGQTVSKESPIDIMPLFVKAGSIIPFGPKVQYAEEKKWDNLHIRVYEGADGKFTLYEDENDNYNYEKGICSTILFSWDNANKTLTINDRQGCFPGMLQERQFSIEMVSKGKNAEDKDGKVFNKVINYTGKKVSVKL